MALFNRQANHKTSHSSEVLRGIFFFQLIVVLQIFVIALLALVVLFLKGFAQFFYWIIFGGAGLVALTSWYLYRRFKKSGLDTLKNAINSPGMQGRDVEVRLMGGMVSFKLGQQEAHPNILETSQTEPLRQLEDPETARIRELTELSRLLEKDLITLEEFNRSKSRILRD